MLKKEKYLYQLQLDGILRNNFKCIYKKVKWATVVRGGLKDTCLIAIPAQCWEGVIPFSELLHFPLIRTQ